MSASKKKNTSKKKNNNVKKTTNQKKQNTPKQEENYFERRIFEENKFEDKEKTIEEKKIEKNKTEKAKTEKKVETPKKEISKPKTEKKSIQQNVEKKEKKQEPKKEIPKQEEKPKKELVKSKDKSLVKTTKDEEKPEYVKQMLKNKKKKTIIFIIIVTLILLLIAFSTIFAIMNLNNNTIAKGIYIKNVDVSGLTKEEAKQTLTEVLEKELMKEINLKYSEEYNITLNPKQIEFTYDIDNIIAEAYDIGRNGNIVQNNYKLLFTSFLTENLDIKYSYNEELLDDFIDDINSKIPGVVVEPSYYIEGTKLIIDKGIDGVQVKKQELKDEIINNISSRTLELVTQEGFNQIIKIPVENVKASAIDMDKIYSEIYREPQDAYYVMEPYQIYPDVDGIDLAVSVEDAKNIISKEDKEEYTFNLKISKAEKTLDDLGTEAFPYLISSFTTKYDASNTNRSTNLRIAAEKINGKVLMPGEVFSYNKVVGKRTVEEGYKDAKIYANGGVVDGLAGGICQISSTLYNAVLLANLEIVERRNHSYTTSYVPAGRDATVVWGTTDFQFKNSRTYPIKIEASVKNGIAEFKIHGMQEEVEYEIRILPQVTSTIPYTTQQIVDPTLAPGQQVVSQSGHLGYKVTTYIEKTANGNTTREVLSNDTYQPMHTIIKVGPAAVTAAPVQ